jgi:hypothetical protein
MYMYVRACVGLCMRVYVCVCVTLCVPAHVSQIFSPEHEREVARPTVGDTWQGDLEVVGQPL